MAATISRKPAAPSLDEIERFIAALPIGAENAITARKVAVKLGFLMDDEVRTDTSSAPVLSDDESAELAEQQYEIPDEPAQSDYQSISNAERKVRLLSEYAVFRGYVYCTGNRGYYRPDSGELRELEETIGRRESQARRHLQWCQQMRANVTRSLHQGRLI